MENQEKGLFITNKVFAILFASFTFIYGILLAVAYSYQYTSVYDQYSGNYYEAYIFAPGTFIAILLILFVYMAFPVLLTLMCFRINNNRKLILPAFILVLALMPLGGYLGLSSIFSGASVYRGGYGGSSVLSSISIVFIILIVHLALVIVTLLVIMMMKDKPGECSRNIEKQSEAEKLLNKKVNSSSEAFEAIVKAKQLLDAGALTEAEFKAIKAKLL